MCMCMCVCHVCEWVWVGVCVCVHSRPESNWLWLHFYRIFTGRSGSGPSRRNGIKEENSSPHPRHTLLPSVWSHICALWLVSSITWVISIINEVCWWQKWYQRRRRRKEDQRNGASQQLIIKQSKLWYSQSPIKKNESIWKEARTEKDHATVI